MSGLSLSGQTIQVYSSDSLGNNVGVWTDTPAGGWICVRITGNFPVVIPRLLLLANTIPVEARSVMRSESN